MKTCPLCEQKVAERLPNGDTVLTGDNFHTFRFCGCDLIDIRNAIFVAKAHGWVPRVRGGVEKP